MIRNPNEIQDGAKKIRMLIAGYPGIGKSTLALSAPNPLHIDVDFGIDRIEPRYTTIWELGLADILIPANSIAISAANITDTRLDAERCGAVAQTIGELDTSPWFAQIQAMAEETERNTSTLIADLRRAVEQVESLLIPDGAVTKEKLSFDLQQRVDAVITTEQGVHGLRYYEKKLQANVEGEWINVGGAGLTITAAVETGSVVTATREDGESVSVESVDGTAILELPGAGTYSVYAEYKGAKSETVQVECSGNYPASMRYIKLTVTVDVGSEITISDGKTTLNGTSTGSEVFYLPNTGTWTVKAELNGEETSETISISEYKDYSIELKYVLPLNDYTWEQIQSFPLKVKLPVCFQ